LLPKRIGRELGWQPSIKIYGGSDPGKSDED